MTPVIGELKHVQRMLAALARRLAEKPEVSSRVAPPLCSACRTRWPLLSPFWRLASGVWRLGGYGCFIA